MSGFSGCQSTKDKREELLCFSRSRRVPYAENCSEGAYDKWKAELLLKFYKSAKDRLKEM